MDPPLARLHDWWRPARVASQSPSKDYRRKGGVAAQTQLDRADTSLPAAVVAFVALGIRFVLSVAAMCKDA